MPALRFHYSPNDGNRPDAWAERTLHWNPQRECWIRFDLRVPKNYTHRNSSPSNNKLLAVFMDGYSSKGNGPTVIWEMWSDGNGGSRVAVHYSRGQRTTANAHRGHTQFISTRDRGRWMTIVFRMVAASSRGSNNGIIQLWRRWKGDSQWTKIHDMRNADIASPPGGPNGWRTAKLMGWSNSGFSRETYIYLDNIAVADASLLTG